MLKSNCTSYPPATGHVRSLLATNLNFFNSSKIIKKCKVQLVLLNEIAAYISKMFLAIKANRCRISIELGGKIITLSIATQRQLLRIERAVCKCANSQVARFIGK